MTFENYKYKHMKKTLRIHIGGYIFNIDEDAFQSLKQWLDAIFVKYEHEKDGEEIFNDIELRVAELFVEKVGNEGTIRLKTVNEIIQVMGSPEDFDPEEENTKSKEEPIFSRKETEKQKRLYRSRNNRIIAGVCGGLGDYFGIDPVIIRLLFFAAFIFAGTGTILYIILWIVVPEGVSVSHIFKNTKQKRYNFN